MVLKLLFVLIILIINSFQNEINDEYKNQIKIFESLINKYLSNPEMNKAYLSHKQYINFTKEISKDFPDIINTSSIGETYLKNQMPLISFKSNTKSKKSGILFTGMHHAREPVAMMMNIYIILYLISLPINFRTNFLNNINIYFIPIINIDGYIYNSEQYEKYHNLKICEVRKNRKPHNNIKCNNDSLGIDLNRNYDFYFGIDNIGSSDNPCEEDYRGEKPFSEPETENIKNFIENNNEVKIVINYHTFGNLVITPFNYLKSNDNINKLKENYFEFYKIYNEFNNEANYPKGYIFGNGDKAINYTTNGDATDWFFGKMNKLSFSPELGNGKRNSENFFPNKNVTFDICQKNLESALYTIQKSNFFLKGFFIHGFYVYCNFNKRIFKEKILCNDEQVLLYFIINLENRGFGDYDNKNLINLKLNITNNKIREVYSICSFNSNSEKQCNENSTFLIFKLNENIQSLKNKSLKFELIINRKEFMEIINNSSEIQFFKITNNNSFYSEIMIDNSIKQFIWLFDSPKINIYNLNFSETTIENIYEKEINKEFNLKYLLLLINIFFFIIICYIKRKIVKEKIKNCIFYIINHIYEKKINEFPQIEIPIPQNDISETSEINQKDDNIINTL